jgi:type VI protein secretion system component Hcp
MAFDTYIYFPFFSGIHGEAGAEYAKYLADFCIPIQLTNWSGLGAEMSVTIARSDVGGATTGRSKVRQFSCSANVDKSVTALAFHCAAGSVFDKVAIRMFVTLNEESSSNPLSLLLAEFVLSYAVIDDFSVEIGGGDELPTMTFNLNVGGLYIKYWGIDKEKRGTRGKTPHQFGWDTVRNIELPVK